MSDERVETLIDTPRGEISFQEYFVKERWTPEVLAVRFVGVENCRPAQGVIEAIRAADAIIVCPSNPVTSIGPILAVPGIRDALNEAEAPVIAVSPLIGSSAISGPAHKLMTACGWESSALGVAKSYGDFLDTLLIDTADRRLAEEIERLNIQTVCTDIRMNSLADKLRLAREVLALIEK
jgi:LPPG:FO 2-phospho-L-lactate transferase